MFFNLLIEGKWIGPVLSGEVVWMIFTIGLTERNIITLPLLVCSCISKPGISGMFRRTELVMDLTVPTVGRRGSGLTKPVHMRGQGSVGVPGKVSSMKT